MQSDAEYPQRALLTVEADESIELFLIKCMSQIPEVESVYKYDDGVCTVFFTVLSSEKYQREANMKIYEVEYMMLRHFSEADIEFRCIPRLDMADEDFLPKGVSRLYKRPEK